MPPKSSKKLLFPLLHNILNLHLHVEPFITYPIICCICEIIIDTTYILLNFDVNIFLQYAPSYLICCYALAANIMYKVMVREFVVKGDLFDLLFTQSIVHVSIEIKQKFLVTMNWIRVMFAMEIVSTAVLVLIYLYYWNRYMEEYLIIASVVHKYVSDDFFFSVLICCIVDLLYLLTGFTTMALSNSFMYFIFLINTQIYLLIDYVHKVKRSKSQTNHQEIRKSLQIIVEKHLGIRESNKRLMQENQLIFGIFVLVGVIIGICVVLVIFSPRYNTCQGVTLAIAFLVYAYALCSCGQNYADAGADLVGAIYDMDWYEWNVECQKSFLILFMNISQGMDVSVFSFFTVGNDLLKGVFRFLYSVGNVLHSTKK